jgi:hypothetical protein
MPGKGSFPSHGYGTGVLTARAKGGHLNRWAKGIAWLFWPAEEGERIMRRYRDFLEAAPDDVGGAALHLTGPQEEFVPDALQGRLCCSTLLVHAGEEEEARRVLAPMLGLGHSGAHVDTTPYADFQCLLDDPPGYRNYWSAEYLSGFPDAAVAAFCVSAEAMLVPSPSQHPLFPQGGAIARGPSEFPIPRRRAPWAVHPFGLWEDAADDGAGKDWAKGVRKAMRPWASGPRDGLGSPVGRSERRTHAGSSTLSPLAEIENMRSVSTRARCWRTQGGSEMDIDHREAWTAHNGHWMPLVQAKHVRAVLAWIRRRCGKCSPAECHLRAHAKRRWQRPDDRQGHGPSLPRTSGLMKRVSFQRSRTGQLATVPAPG